jgi:outer membrane lipoprotein-sorting protein
MWSSLFCAASVAASFAVAAAELSAAQIVEKNVAARGGLQSWRAVNTMTFVGEMDAGGKQNAKLPFVMSLKRPHKSRLEIRFQDQTSVQTYDGQQGWKFRPYLGRDEVEPLTPAEAASAAAADEFDGPLVDYARKGAKVEFQGMETVEGKSAYKLKLTRANALPRNVWLDAQSFLEVKIDGEPRKLDGRPHKVAIFYRDYKKVGALTLPHTLETVVDGVKQTHKISIKTVTVNSALDDALFAKPQPNALKAAS